MWREGGSWRSCLSLILYANNQPEVQEANFTSAAEQPAHPYVKDCISMYTILQRDKYYFQWRNRWKQVWTDNSHSPI